MLLEGPLSLFPDQEQYKVGTQGKQATYLLRTLRDPQVSG